MAEARQITNSLSRTHLDIYTSTWRHSLKFIIREHYHTKEGRKEPSQNYAYGWFENKGKRNSCKMIAQGNFIINTIKKERLLLNDYGEGVFKTKILIV